MIDIDYQSLAVTRLLALEKILTIANTYSQCPCRDNECNSIDCLKCKLAEIAIISKDVLYL